MKIQLPVFETFRKVEINFVKLKLSVVHSIELYISYLI